MINETVFEILVYSCDQNDLNRRVQLWADEVMDEVPGQGSDFWKKQYNEVVESKWRTARFKELIGAIEIHTVMTQLRADYWMSEKKRIVPLSVTKGRIRHIGKMIQPDYSRSPLTSGEIFDDFIKKLRVAIRATPRLTRRFIDFETFERIGPQINWRALLKI